MHKCVCIHIYSLLVLSNASYHMHVFRADHLLLDASCCALPWGDYFSHSQHPLEEIHL